MAKLTTPVEVYKILPKSNCRDCGISTCLAFSAAVIKEQKRLADCPHIPDDIRSRFEGKIETPTSMERSQVEMLKHLQKEIAAMDFSAKVERLGAVLQGENLVIKCLGKDFEIDRMGNIVSHCHTHAGFAVLLLTYVLGGGRDIARKWVPFRDLKSGGKWSGLFEQRCEKPLKEIADTYTDLFGDLISIFSGQSSANHFSSDITVVLYPFPKVPALICYWRPEDDLESKLHIFFDNTAEENLNIQSVFAIGAGLVSMLEKIMAKHISQ